MNPSWKYGIDSSIASSGWMIFPETCLMSAAIALSVTASSAEEMERC